MQGSDQYRRPLWRAQRVNRILAGLRIDRATGDWTGAAKSRPLRPLLRDYANEDRPDPSPLRPPAGEPALVDPTHLGTLPVVPRERNADRCHGPGQWTVHRTL